MDDKHRGTITLEGHTFDFRATIQHISRMFSKYFFQWMLVLALSCVCLFNVMGLLDYGVRGLFLIAAIILLVVSFSKNEHVDPKSIHLISTALLLLLGGFVVELVFNSLIDFPFFSIASLFVGGLILVAIILDLNILRSASKIEMKIVIFISLAVCAFTFFSAFSVDLATAAISFNKGQTGGFQYPNEIIGYIVTGAVVAAVPVSLYYTRKFLREYTGSPVKAKSDELQKFLKKKAREEKKGRVAPTTVEPVAESRKMPEKPSPKIQKPEKPKKEREKKDERDEEEYAPIY